MSFKATGIFFLICIWETTFLFSQDNYQMKPNTDETVIDFLSSYYNQDGNHSPVTGGIGTQHLTDFATGITVNVPLDSVNSIDILWGADFYSSASTDKIDNNVSSASSSDVRVYGTVGYNRKNLKRGETYGIHLGASKEYDYTSFNGGVSFTKEFNEDNTEISLNGKVYLDNWKLIFPIELRSEVKLPTDKRKSYNAQLVFSQVLTKRLQMSISGEIVYMKGLLSTPFHRVFFEDQSQHDIERLPNTRLKIPLGIRLNYYPFDNFIVRSYYRFYTDDWGIDAHTLGIETPVKITSSWTVQPFYRYHTQTHADHFAAFGVNKASQQFYTSDYDLAALHSHKVGMGLRYAPLYGLARVKLHLPKIKIFQLKSLEVRGGYYTQSTGLNSFFISLDLTMGIRNLTGK